MVATTKLRQQAARVHALVGGVLAGVVGDTMLYVSGGAEHQSPAGGAPVAIIGKVS